MNISSTRSSLKPRLGNPKDQSPAQSEASPSPPQDGFKSSSSNPIKSFVKERPARAAATAFALGVALPAALGAEFGLGFQGIGNVVSAGAVVAMLAGSTQLLDSAVGRVENPGVTARRGLGDMMAGISVAFVSPGGTPLAAAGIALGTAMAVL